MAGAFSFRRPPHLLYLTASRRLTALIGARRTRRNINTVDRALTTSGLFFGTMQDFATAFYKSKAWQRCRDNYLRSQRGLCERCLSRGIYRAGVIVHHKIHLTPENINNPTITMDPNNLMLLCRDCHAIIHKPTKRFRVDELGRVIVRE